MNFEDLNTLFNHQELIELPKGNTPLVNPVYKSSKYTMNYSRIKKLFAGEEKGFVYSRVANPTVRSLENLLAKATGKEDGICFSSGLQAIFNVMITNLNSGDHAIAFIESYKPTRMILKETLNRFGVESTFMSLDEVKNLDQYKKENTKMIFFEGPTNPQLRVPDFQFIINFAKKNNIQSVFDNTFGGFHQNNELDCDFLIHSLTKYASGHSDMTGGIVLGSEENCLKLRLENFKIGATLSPEHAYTTLQGLKTYSLRYEKQVVNTKKIGEFLIKTGVKNLSFLFDPNHPDKENIKRYMKDCGTLLYFDAPVKNDQEFEDFFNKLKLFKLAGSLGATESLIAPANLFYSGDLDSNEAKKAKINEYSVRLSIGIEDAEDLIADLRGALSI